MSPIIWLRHARLPPLGTRGPLTAAIRCQTSRILSLESSAQLVRRASSSPKSKLKPNPKPKAGPAPASKPLHAQRLILYHVGGPRVLVLGVLKISAIFILGFFAVVTVPSYIQAGAPWWQTAGVIVAGTIPFFAMWYLTSPMVMWIHLPVSKGFQRAPEAVKNFIRNVPGDAKVAITTMGIVGRPRVSQVKLQDLRREKRRFGLVNYVRNVRRAENATRKWYQFGAVKEFKIEDGVIADRRSKQIFMWYDIMKAFEERKRQGKPHATPRRDRA